MRTLFLNGEISDETWFGDEVTPGIFRSELEAGEGSINVWINSPGGDVFAAAQIYTMLMDYPHDVTVMIDGLAASAASVIAMAGTKAQMSPVAMMMIHNPATIAIGDSEEMKKAIKMLDEVNGMKITDEANAPVMFSRQAVMNSMLSKLIPPKKPEAPKIPVDQLEKRLNLLMH